MEPHPLLKFKYNGLKAVKVSQVDDTILIHLENNKVLGIGPRFAAGIAHYGTYDVPDSTWELLLCDPKIYDPTYDFVYVPKKLTYGRYE